MVINTAGMSPVFTRSDQLRIVSGLFRFISRVLILVGVVSLMLAYLLFEFMSRAEASPEADAYPPTAIVFTGDFDRIDRGLALLSSQSIDRLFITGVNGDAGLSAERFATQFNLTNDQITWLTNGQIVLAPDAHTTFENALEAGCWLDTQPHVDAVALITSRAHMARASAALAHNIWPTRVVRVISDPTEQLDRRHLDLVDFGEFLATWFVTFLPHDFWPANEPRLCEMR